MKIKVFIDRPILAGVISVVILIIGLIGLSQLPIEQFPEIAPPTVSVSASYTGANAETVQKSVVVPLEEALSGEYDVHGFIIYEYWICENYNLFSSGYRSRYGDGQCTKSYS